MMSALSVVSIRFSKRFFRWRFITQLLFTRNR